MPARFRPKEKLTCEQCREAIVDAGGVPKESHRAWAQVPDVCEVDQLTDRTKRLCVRDGPPQSVIAPVQHKAQAKAQQKQDQFDIESAMKYDLCEDTRECLVAEVAGMEPGAALEHVLRRRKEM